MENRSINKKGNLFIGLGIATRLMLVVLLATTAACDISGESESVFDTGLDYDDTDDDTGKSNGNSEIGNDTGDDCDDTDNDTGRSNENSEIGTDSDSDTGDDSVVLPADTEGEDPMEDIMSDGESEKAASAAREGWNNDLSIGVDGVVEPLPDGLIDGPEYEPLTPTLPRIPSLQIPDGNPPEVSLKFAVNNPGGWARSDKGLQLNASIKDLEDEFLTIEWLTREQEPNATNNIVNVCGGGMTCTLILKPNGTDCVTKYRVGVRVTDSDGWVTMATLGVQLYDAECEHPDWADGPFPDPEQPLCQGSVEPDLIAQADPDCSRCVRVRNNVSNVDSGPSVLSVKGTVSPYEDWYVVVPPIAAGTFYDVVVEPIVFDGVLCDIMADSRDWVDEHFTYADNVPDGCYWPGAYDGERNNDTQLVLN